MNLGALTSCLEKVLQGATEGPEGLARARAAHVEFARLGGAFEDSDPCFEERTQAFLDWFVFDHRGPTGLTVAEAHLASRTPDAGDPGCRGAAPHPTACTPPDEVEGAALAGICRSMRGLLRIERVTPERVELTELCGGASFSAHAIGDTAGLGVGDIVDGHLVPFDGQVVLARGLVFHPREAREPIEELVPRALAQHETREHVLFALLRMRMRFDRYRGIRAAKIYRYPFTEFP